MTEPGIWRAALLLATFGALGGGAVALTHELTVERIAANQRAALQRQIDSVLPASAYDNDPLGDALEVIDPLLGEVPATVYRARRGGRGVAAILRVSTSRGYGGTIVLIVAIYLDGRIAGVRTLEHRETPGLGDGIDAARSPWIETFAGTSLQAPAQGWAVRRDGGAFDQFTGATITPRAVVGTVHSALLYFEANRVRLFAAPA